MNSADHSDLEIGPALKLSFALLVSLILGGNGLLLWQFHLARLQTERLTDVSQQLIGVLRLQVSLLSVHQRLDELAQSRDAGGLATESEPLRRALLEQTQSEMNTLTRLPYEAHVDPEFQPTLQAIEITLPTQLEAINGLASSGDWKALHLRLDNELKPVESLCATLVAGIDQEVSGELALAVAKMRQVQFRIFLVVQVTGIATFLVVTVLGWAVIKRILTLRIQERLAERTRIARELHDTLLQGFIYASMQLNMLADQMPPDLPAKPSFLRALQVTDRVIDEGRKAVQGFRMLDTAAQRLEWGFARVMQELDVEERIDFRVHLKSPARSLRPLIREEVYLIGREALLNAFRHSGASGIVVELDYSADRMQVLVRDDGCGISSHVLKSGRDLHWGLSGMHERTEKIGGKLTILSPAPARAENTPSGTEIELSIPGKLAYEPRAFRLEAGWFARLFPGKRSTDEFLSF